MKNIFQKATGRIRAGTAPSTNTTSNEDTRTDSANQEIMNRTTGSSTLSKEMQEKVDQLQGMFSDLSPFVITNTLKESNGDVERAVDSLLNLQAIESARNNARRDRSAPNTAHPEPPKNTYSLSSNVFSDGNNSDPMSGIAENSDPNAPAEDQLVHAARHQNMAKLKTLVESKSGAQITNPWTNALQNALNLTIATKNVEGMRLILRNGAKVDGPENTSQTRSPLGHAIHAAAAECAFVLLNEFRADPNKLSGPRSPLHMAVSSSMNTVVGMLLEKGADLNAIELDSGRTALHMAVATGSLDVVTLLLNSGLDITIKDYSGETAPHLAFRTAKSQRDLILLHLLLEKLRDIGGYDLQNSRTGDTLLHIAAHRSQNSSQMFELVLKFLPNPFLPNASGQSSLDIALLSPNDSVKALVLSYTETYPTVHAIEVARQQELEKLKKGQTENRPSSANSTNPSSHLGTFKPAEAAKGPLNSPKADGKRPASGSGMNLAHMLPLVANSMALQGEPNIQLGNPSHVSSNTSSGINFVPVAKNQDSNTKPIASPQAPKHNNVPQPTPSNNTNPFRNNSQDKVSPSSQQSPQKEVNLIDPFVVHTTNVPSSPSNISNPLMPALPSLAPTSLVSPPNSLTSNYASLPNYGSLPNPSSHYGSLPMDKSFEPAAESLRRASIKLDETPVMALLPVQDPDYLLVKKFKESLEGDLAEFEAEYESMEAASTDQIYKGDFTSSLTKINLPKNRYRNILPLEQTRVKLQALDNVESSDYINANYVKSELKGDRAYILTQGPLDSTAADFWRMVWEQGCSIIIMLSTFVEDGKSKVFPYFPVDDSEMDAGFFTVSLLEEKDDVQMITRKFCLKLRHNGEKKEIMHLQYVAWPDQGIPKDTRGFRKIIDDADSFNESNSSLIVHCSAGIGRSGVFCVVHSILTKLRALLAASFETTFSIQETLSRMRLDRIALVQNKEQYVFCCMALRDTLVEILDVISYKNENWFHRTLNPAKAAEKLNGKPPGHFLFSPSSQVGNLLLSRVGKDGKVVQEQIQITERGFIARNNVTHERLSDLVKEMGTGVLSRHVIA
eukprot:TRINITY_DN3162_c1_g1_i2.p1 TRINITY_DN3162_c1_g1~~TRINITY_DN3162_c1_g1_i2.p1  ORF type:complete len:1072 (-),score=356.89 TRINITY_DN3162_c1_g1_i2:53-3268(-)